MVYAIVMDTLLCPYVMYIHCFVRHTIPISRFRTCIYELRPSFHRMKTVITPSPFCNISGLAPNVDIQFSVQDTFLELPLVGALKVKRFESKII